MTFLIFLFLCLLFPNPTSAAPQIEINSIPDTIESGTTFPVIFNIKNADIGSSFYYKFFGGIGDSNTQIQTTPSLSYTSSWDSFTNFITTIDTGGSSVVNSFAYVNSNSPTGTYNLSIRIALTPKTTSSWNTTTSDSPISLSVHLTPACTYTYSDWGVCSSDSKQTRTVTLTSSNECIGTSEPTTQSCTYDATITNPSSGISLTEFMPYSDPEWVEFYNSNDYPVKLVSWKLEDKDGNTRNISSLDIGVTSYAVFGYSPFFDNTNSESVIIRDQDNSAIAQVSYDAGLRTLDRSWVLINGSWCQSSITKSYENVTSCYVDTTPTPDSTKYTVDEDATASAIIEPKTEESFLSPTSTPQPTPTATSGLILGDKESSSNTTPKNYFPLILIMGGALLLISPIVIDKIKKHKK